MTDSGGGTSGSRWLNDGRLEAELAGYQIIRESSALIRLAPFVQIAWADGSMGREEKERIEDIAQRAGVIPGTAAWATLDDWSAQRPPDRLFEACLEALRMEWQALPVEQAAHLRRETLWTCERIAWASGGFFNLGTRVSGNEQETLEKIARALSPEQEST